MSARTVSLLVLGSSFLLLQPASAQVTYGKKPQLPPPFATKSASNGPSRVKVPDGFLPTVPPGFHVNVFAREFKYVRFLATAPNGDIFVADTGAGQVDVLRDPQHTGGATQREVFAGDLKRPFGIAFHGDYVYIGNTGEVVRFRYDQKTAKRTGDAEHILDLPPYGGHTTRTLAFSPDGQHLYINVGSSGNIDIEKDQRRAAILVCDPDGKNSRIFASGLRNSVGLAIDPATSAVWAAVNERDELGDDLPPDYLTAVKDGGFYG
jgi:glucose/arabinose dehydrogenase